MPATLPPNSDATETAARLDRLDRMANMLDSRFRIPGLGVRFGWDSILGLIPGLGDVATALPSGYMIYQGARMGARRHVLAQMGANAALDLVVGGVPLLGDVFDVFFKGHRRNIALLKREMAHLDPGEQIVNAELVPRRAGDET